MVTSSSPCHLLGRASPPSRWEREEGTSRQVWLGWRTQRRLEGGHGLAQVGGGMTRVDQIAAVDSESDWTIARLQAPD